MAKNFSFSVSGQKTTVVLDTGSIFNESYVEPAQSPIDCFSDEVGRIVTMLGSPSLPLTAEWRVMANLSVLGVVSSVETYFRRMIRRTLMIDSISQECSYDKNLPYGAAIHHDQSLLPEALMEGMNFSTEKSIRDGLKSLLGVSVGQNEKVLAALKQYDVVCNLRHCIVHRSGRLGAKNAIRFGLNDHGRFLEKPIEVDFDSVHEIFAICRSLVQEVNDFVFCELLKRSGGAIRWKKDLRKDKPHLKKYFDIFCVEEKNNNSELKECHKLLMKVAYVP